MMNEEQAHIAWLKEKAESIGLTFDQYMLFLIFEALDHSPVLNQEQLTPSPWESEQPAENDEGFNEGGL
jgi:hypothetical protein